MENIKFKNSDGIEYELLWKKPHHTYNADGLCYSPDLKNRKRGKKVLFRSRRVNKQTT